MAGNNAGEDYHCIVCDEIRRAETGVWMESARYHAFFYDPDNFPTSGVYHDACAVKYAQQFPTEERRAEQLTDLRKRIVEVEKQVGLVPQEAAK